MHHGGRFLGNHSNIIGKHVFVLSMSSPNTSENLASKISKMEKKTTDVFVVVDASFSVSAVNTVIDNWLKRNFLYIGMIESYKE